MSLHINVPQSGPVKASMKTSLIVAEAMFDVVFVGIGIGALVIGLSQHPINPAELLIFVLMVMLVVAATRAPWSTTIDGDALITQRLRGRKSISLANVASVKNVAQSRQNTCLRIKDSNGHTVFLELHSVPIEQRFLLFPRLEDKLFALVSADKRSLRLWKKWFGITTRATRTVGPVGIEPTTEGL
jgi:4-amino-4-deoxy-L-arabinose transferase-like glycosyltransferase